MIEKTQRTLRWPKQKRRQHIQVLTILFVILIVMSSFSWVDIQPEDPFITLDLYYEEGYNYFSSSVTIHVSASFCYSEIHSTLGGEYVDGFPVWKDVSGWEDGDNVIIVGRTFTLSERSISVRAGYFVCWYGESGNYQVYYDKMSGILIRKQYDYSDSSGGLSYTADVDLSSGNPLVTTPRQYVLESLMIGSILSEIYIIILLCWRKMNLI